MYEDASLEEALFPAGGRICCIASAGCTAIRLAKHHEVTAVDINPIQLAYARSRAAGAPMEPGAAERLMARGRVLLRLAGWTRPRLGAFLDLDDPPSQTAFWQDQLDNRRFRRLLGTLLSARLLAGFYQPALLDALPPHFSRVLRGRMERCWGRHPNRSNPYAHALLLGTAEPDSPGPAPRPITFVHADIAGYLEAQLPGSFDGFSFSNIADGASPAYWERLLAAAHRAGRPGSLIILRSFGLPSDPAGPDPAERDRCFLWGRVEVGEIESFL
ncbi:MAG TPA: hypothetical protein VHC86_12925 [Opitutaceae bacterium]|nr:hypothetical protein [Opitutaceae bacterium]